VVFSIRYCIIKALYDAQNTAITDEMDRIYRPDWFFAFLPQTHYWAWGLLGSHSQFLQLQCVMDHHFCKWLSNKDCNPWNRRNSALFHHYNHNPVVIAPMENFGVGGSSKQPCFVWKFDPSRNTENRKIHPIVNFNYRGLLDSRRSSTVEALLTFMDSRRSSTVEGFEKPFVNFSQ